MHDHCHIDTVQKNATSEERKRVERIWLTVWGMGCPNCAARIHNSLVTLKGVIRADVDHVMGTAEVEFNPHMITVPTLVGAVAKAGNDGRHAYRAVALEK